MPLYNSKEFEDECANHVQYLKTTFEENPDVLDEIYKVEDILGFTNMYHSYVTLFLEIASSNRSFLHVKRDFYKALKDNINELNEGQSRWFN